MSNKPLYTLPLTDVQKSVHGVDTFQIPSAVYQTAVDKKADDDKCRERMKRSKWLTDAKAIDAMIAARRAVLDATLMTTEPFFQPVKVNPPSKTSFDGMTHNILALTFTNLAYYKGCNTDLLLDQLWRLSIVASNIGERAPAWVALQEVEEHARANLLKLLGGEYIASALAGEFDDDHTSLATVGCAILVHKRYAGRVKFITTTIGGRGLAIADFENGYRAASFHLPWKPKEQREKVYAIIGEVAKHFEGFKSGAIGMDWNLFASDVRIGLEQKAPMFAKSIKESDYKMPTFLHAEDPAKCGAMDFIAHFGPCQDKATPLQFPVPSIPDKAENLPAACDNLAKLYGSDHAPLVVQFPYCAGCVEKIAKMQ